MISTLTLRPAAREGSDVGKAVRSRLEYLDFIVDGAPLATRLGPLRAVTSRSADYVPVLVLNWPGGFPAEDYGQLVGQASSLPDGRVPLYVCAECGDLGCGGITAVVDHDISTVTWREFGYQNSYEPLDADGLLQHVGPFVFDRTAYLEELQQFRDTWRPDAAPSAATSPGAVNAAPPRRRWRGSR